MTERVFRLGRLGMWIHRHGTDPRKFGIEFYPDRHWALDISVNRFLLALWWDEEKKS